MCLACSESDYIPKPTKLRTSLALPLWHGSMRYLSVLIFISTSFFSLLGQDVEIVKVIDKNSLAAFDLFTLDKDNFRKNQSTLQELRLQLNPSSLHQIKKTSDEEIILSLPWFDGEQKKIKLTQSPILSPSYKLTTSAGQIKSESDIRTYHGSFLEGKGVMSLTMSDDELRAILSIGDANYQITKDNKKSNSYVLFDIVHAGARKDYGCFSDDQLISARLPESHQSSTKSTSDHCIPIYIETDFTTFSHFNGDVSSVESYMIALLNEVALLYSQENINLSLSGMHIVTAEEDDYTATVFDAQEAIEVFAEKRKNHFFGQLAHFVTVRNLLGGVGWIGTLCSDYDTFEADLDHDGVVETHHFGPYAVSSALDLHIENVPIYTWDVFIFAHELGHNLGSPHTHACAWGSQNLAIDNCLPTEGGCGLIEHPIPSEDVGTIMSYCHLTSTGIDFTRGLGGLPGDLMRTVISNSSCFLSCEVDEIPGCLDESYHDFNPHANVNDNSCSETCDDGVMNGDETGVDCGGLLCPDCSSTCEQNYVAFELTLDGFPTETKWILKDSVTGDTIDHGGPYPTSMAHQTIFFEYCLSSGTLDFIITDLFGDGICCSNGTGSYLFRDNSANVII